MPPPPARYISQPIARAVTRPLEHSCWSRDGQIIIWVMASSVCMWFCLAPSKFCVNRTIWRWNTAKKTICKMASVRHVGFVKFYVFFTWPSSESKFSSAYQISSKSFDSWMRYSEREKPVFQYDGRPPSWICYDVIVLHVVTAFYVLNTTLNFHDWFRIFWTTLISWLEIAYSGPNVDILGVNGGGA